MLEILLLIVLIVIVLVAIKVYLSYEWLNARSPEEESRIQDAMERGVVLGGYGGHGSPRHFNREEAVTYVRCIEPEFPRIMREMEAKHKRERELMRKTR